MCLNWKRVSPVRMFQFCVPTTALQHAVFISLFFDTEWKQSLLTRSPSVKHNEQKKILWMWRVSTKNRHFDVSKWFNKELIGTYTQHGYRWMDAIWIPWGWDWSKKGKILWSRLIFFLLMSPCLPKRTVKKSFFF